MGIHWTFYLASRCSESGDLKGLWCVRKGDEARIGRDRFAGDSMQARGWLLSNSEGLVLTLQCPYRAVRSKTREVDCDLELIFRVGLYSGEDVLI
jgi:hypothetical protein